MSILRSFCGCFAVVVIICVDDGVDINLRYRQQSSVYNLCAGFESFVLLCWFFVWVSKLLNIKRLICVNAKWHAPHRIQFCIVLLRIIFVVCFFFVVYNFYFSNRLFCGKHAHFRCTFSNWFLFFMQNHFCNIFDELTSDPIVCLRYLYRFFASDRIAIDYVILTSIHLNRCLSITMPKIQCSAYEQI